MEPNYPLSTGRSGLLGTETFRNLLAASLKNAKKSVIILSAYVKEVGVKWMQEQITDSNVKCTIVARWDKSDIAQGSSDLGCYHLAKERNWDFKILKDLHAKVMLVDNKDLFLGSPNLTGHGMSLVPVFNKEIGINIVALESDLKIIYQLVDESILINDQIINELEKWKKNLPEITKEEIPSFPKKIQDIIKERFDKLWVHNFPWSKIEVLLKNYNKKDENTIHDLELFGLTNVNFSRLEVELKKSFEQSKIFKWLLQNLKKSENEEIYFGSLSSIIHNSLLDDPKPYRQNVKLLQANLYSYIKYLNLDNIEIDVPGDRSERVKLKS
jgi:hypothetical protein